MSLRKLGIITLFLFISSGLIIIGKSAFNQLACEGQPISIRLTPTVAQQIWGEQVLSQSFVAPRNGLNRIDLLFQTYRRQNTYDVTLRLLEVPPHVDNPLLGVERLNLTFNAATVRDQTWRTFTFPPMPDTAGKTYLISLQSTEAISGNAITVGGIEWNVYAPGSAFVKPPTPVLADMAFRTCYQMTALEKLQVLSWQITHDRPALWGNVNFYLATLFVYAMLLIGFFWKMIRLIL